MATRMVPSEWMPPARATRIIIHWTAGAYVASAHDRKSYHLLIEGDGKLVRGTHSIAANDSTSDADGYAAHTRGLNTGSIGIALCAMAGASDRPFTTGRYPITIAQWEALGAVCADLCERYGIEPIPQEVLTHAEVQSVLGVEQRGKWDIMATPQDSPMRLRSPEYVGNQIRQMISEEMDAISAPATGAIERIELAAGQTLVVSYDGIPIQFVTFDPEAREITIRAEWRLPR